MWRIYVDDTFVLWPHDADQLEEFHTHLNKQHRQIQFTKEKENDNQISFHDVLVKRTEDSRQCTGNLLTWGGTLILHLTLIRK